jgi:cell wall assembly regulator SMI1
MSVIEKLKQIVQIQNDNTDEENINFTESITDEQFLQIEKLIDERLPDELRELFFFSNGQSKDGKGAFFGEYFIDADEIIKQLQFSRTLIKPANKKIDNPAQSEKLLKEIVDFYFDKAPKHKLLGLKKSWYKLEFSCSNNSFGGPMIYFNKNSTSKEREHVDIHHKEYNKIRSKIKELHQLEENSYNWDELKFVLFSNKEYEVERAFYNFDNEIQFTSTPDNAIKKKYFNYKWLPLFSDSRGNYIGIDFDPDIKGKKGQVINFGRDEEKMFVLGDSLENFFDFIVVEIKKPNTELLNLKYHLHDTLKELIK